MEYGCVNEIQPVLFFIETFANVLHIININNTVYAVSNM